MQRHDPLHSRCIPLSARPGRQFKSSHVLMHAPLPAQEEEWAQNKKILELDLELAKANIDRSGGDAPTA